MNQLGVFAKTLPLRVPSPLKKNTHICQTEFWNKNVDTQCGYLHFNW